MTKINQKNTVSKGNARKLCDQLLPLARTKRRCGWVHSNPHAFKSHQQKKSYIKIVCFNAKGNFLWKREEIPREKRLQGLQIKGKHQSPKKKRKKVLLLLLLLGARTSINHWVYPLLTHTRNWAFSNLCMTLGCAAIAQCRSFSFGAQVWATRREWWNSKSHVGVLLVLQYISGP